MSRARKSRRASPAPRKRKRATRHDPNFISLAIGKKTGRPACILMQAAYKTDYMALSGLFPSELWLVDEVEPLVLITGTPEEWQIYADRIKKGARPNLA